MSFLKLNLNPLEKRVGDCVIRAISSATGKSWENVLTDLFQISLEIKDVPTDKATYSLYLERIGWTKMKSPRIPNGNTYKRMTISEFAEKNNKGKYLVDMANHLTSVEDGTIIDTWNCGYKSVGNYWIKNS